VTAASPGAVGQVPDLSAETPGPVLTVPRAPPAFHVMAKPTWAVCNLDCEYCFFLSKEMLYPGSRFRMAADLQETYLRQLLEAHARAPEVVVAWQGGEHDPRRAPRGDHHQRRPDRPNGSA
jgi:hypothetical protein